MKRNALELLGEGVGWTLTPWVFLGARLRHSRLFHPRGLVFQARVEALASDLGARKVGYRLKGDAIFRVSRTLWKSDRSYPDILGCSIRFLRQPFRSESVEAGDQDLLLASVASPWTLPLDFLRTRTNDFLANTYYSITPFFVEGVGKVKFRLICPIRSGKHGLSLFDRLRRCVEDGTAVFQLEARSYPWGRQWRPWIRIQLLYHLDVDQQLLHFNPFQAGKGIFPRGFINYLRKGPYWVSQQQRLRKRARVVETGSWQSMTGTPSKAQ